MRTEDGYIVRRVLNGEPEAFGLIVDRYKASIYAFAYVKLRNFHDAEDVAQEVFIKAYQKLRRLGTEIAGQLHVSNCRSGQADKGSSHAARGRAVLRINHIISFPVI